MPRKLTFLRVCRLSSWQLSVGGLVAKLLLAGFFITFFSGSASAQNKPLPLHLIKLPPGFKVELYATGITGARSLAIGDQGTVFVGSRQTDNVYALLDRDNDLRADKGYRINQGLTAPNGVAFRNGALYAGEVSRILRFDDIENRLVNPPNPVVVNDSLPKDTWHGWKYLAFGPDGKMYLPVGAPCNVCEQKDFRDASLLRMNEDGSGLEIFAKGIRNTVGFDWSPLTGELWFTDNGRDNLGDDIPSDELNRAPRKDMHFGFPYCHADGIADPEFGKKSPCSQFTPPAVELGAHVASLGMKFYTGKSFPEKYHNQIFVAEHGSWNRSKKVGYRVMAVFIDENQNVIREEVFAEGWKQGEGVWGRPVDLLIMPDGSLLVSDDHAHAVYRISYAP
jgi:glucose/arabinose dehydrogenase